MKVLSERQQFEEWVKSLYGEDARPLKHLAIARDAEMQGRYKLVSTRAMWESWKASREYQEDNRLKVLCWSVIFKEEYREFDIKENIPSGFAFRPYCDGGNKLCWDGEIGDVTEAGVKGYLQPTLDKLKSLYGIEVDEISIWEES